MRHSDRVCRAGEPSSREDGAEHDARIIAAVALVDRLHEAHVVRERDIHTLCTTTSAFSSLNQIHIARLGEPDSKTHAIKCSTVLRILDDLYRRIVPFVHSDVGRKRHLRHAEFLARVGFIIGARDLPHLLHGQRVVAGHGAKAQVDVEEGGAMAGEPARLEGDGAAVNGPVGSVL